MRFLARNLLVLHVAALVLYLTWVHAGTRVEHLHGVPWLCLAMTEVLLLCPQLRKGESLPDAQRRVRRELVRDPLLYVGLALTALLVLQWANGGTGLGLNAAHTRLSYGPPSAPWAPSSVDRAESVQQLYWFTPVWLALLAVRRGILRGARRRLLHILVWNGAALALFGFIQNVSGTRALYGLTPLPGYFFATFGYPNMAGAFFTLLFAVSAGLWLQSALDPDLRRTAHRLLIPVALNFAGALGSLSRAALVLAPLLLLAFAVYAAAATWRRLELGGRVKVLGLSGLTLLVAGGLFVALPESNLRKELADIRPDTFYQDTIGLRLFQFRSAKNMFLDYPLFGVGGWGYRHFARKYVSPEEFDAMVRGPGMANVHNDFLQFAAEHGLVGLGLMLAGTVLLLIPIGGGVRRALRKHPDADAGSDSRLRPLRVSPVGLCVLAGTAATVVHSQIDLPFRSPAILLTWTLCLACAPAFLPRPAAPPAAARAED